MATKKITLNELRQLVKKVIEEEFGHNSNYTIKHPVYVKFILYNKNTGEPIKTKGTSLKSVDEFKLKMTEFKQSLPPEYEEDIEETNGINYYIEIRLVRGQIGSLLKDQKDFLEFIAWSTGDHYELFY